MISRFLMQRGEVVRTASVCYVPAHKGYPRKLTFPSETDKSSASRGYITHNPVHNKAIIQQQVYILYDDII